MSRWLSAVVLVCAGLGLVTGPGLSVAQADLYITVSAWEETANVWVIEGEVYGADPDDTMVYIDGVVGGHWAYVNQDFHYEIVLYLAPGTTGGVTAQAMTWYGDYSNVAETVIN